MSPEALPAGVATSDASYALGVFRVRTALALAVIATCLGLVVTSGQSASAQSGQRCGYGALRVVIAGHQRCLQRGVACRAKLNAAYHGYVFDCHQGYLVYWWRGLLQRAVRIPRLSPGSPCPASEETSLDDYGDYGGPRFGPGPAYPTLALRDGHAFLTYLIGWGYDGWDGTKVLWTVPRYNGPYIVRGRQLDGTGELRFDQGPTWTNKLHEELRLVGPYGFLNPAATFLRAPGCYAYQVDGRGFSYLIVFEAQPK